MGHRGSPRFGERVRVNRVGALDLVRTDVFQKMQQISFISPVGLVLIRFFDTIV